MSKYSPGPWKSHPIEKSHGLPYVPVAAETLIARVYSKHFGDDVQAEANGRLVAAAPELLEALEDVLGEWVRDLIDAGEEDVEGRTYVKFARAAIAKATGATP